MKTTSILLALVVASVGLGLAAEPAKAPKIQFEQTVYDFGSTSQVSTVTGVFKYKNTGTAVLKIEPPKPGCGCTLAELKPDTLPPGETGELAFTLHLGQVKAVFDKPIVVKSNDPETPEVTLRLKADYTPLFDVNPIALASQLSFGVNVVTQFTTLTRTDGKPLRIERLVASQPWVTAQTEAGAKPAAASARIRVTIKRDGPPRRFSEFVQVFVAGQTNGPVASIFVHGQIQGEVVLSPEALYWSIPGAGQPAAERPEALTVQRVTIRSADGKPLELKNPQSSIKGVKAELVTKEAGMVYELVARLETPPPTTVSGNVSFETSVAAQSRIEVPVVINVFNP
jgi:hypothetical protein